LVGEGRGGETKEQKEKEDSFVNKGDPKKKLRNASAEEGGEFSNEGGVCPNKGGGWGSMSPTFLEVKKKKKKK